MFRFVSSLACKVRLPNSSIRLIPARFCWSRDLPFQDIKFVSPRHTKYVEVICEPMKLEGQKLVEAGVHPDVLEYAISLACEEVKKYLKSIARRISTFEEIAQVGAAAAKGNKAIGELVAKAIEQVGTGGHFLLFDEENFDSKLEFFNCMKLNSGHASDFFFTTRRNTEFVWKNPLVLIHENKISNMNIVEKAIVQAGGRRQPLLIVAEGLKEKLGASLMPNKTQLQTAFCVIKPADIQENRKAIMQDLAIFTGAKVLNGASDLSFTPSMLGSCKMVVMSHDEMRFLGGSGCQVAIEERCDQLRSAIKLSTSDYELELLKERLAQLSHTAAVIKVWLLGYLPLIVFIQASYM